MKFGQLIFKKIIKVVARSDILRLKCTKFPRTPPESRPHARGPTQYFSGEGGEREQIGRGGKKEGKGNGRREGKEEEGNGWRIFLPGLSPLC